MTRKLALGLLAGGALLASAVVGGPALLRRAEWFTVDRVEISGTHLLAPHQVLAATGIRPDHNLWDDARPLERALRSHPAIAAASVTRRFPRTLRIRVEEKRPVAYVELEALAPITAAGDILPIDPARARMDLPVIRAPWNRLPRAARQRLLTETERLTRLDPALLAGVSEIRAEPKSQVLVLTHRLAEIIVPGGVGATRLSELRAVLGDLERRLPEAGAGDAPAAPARVDLRFSEQIVVRIPSSV